MPRIIENPNLRKRMLDLIIESRAYFNTASAHDAIPAIQNISFLFDLDRLWYRPETLKALTNLVMEGLDIAKVDYSIIGGITSKSGAFGTVSIATTIAQLKKIPLVVFYEEPYSKYLLHPRSIQDRELLGEQKIVLLKDVLLGGASLRRIYHKIVEIGGNLVAFVILVEHNLYEMWQQDLPPDLPVIILARGPKFPEIHI